MLWFRLSAESGRMNRAPTIPATALPVLCTLLLSCAGSMASPRSPSSNPPSFLLVSMDTCRHDHTGVAGYARDTTPNLDRLAEGGASFSHAYAQSNETLYSHAAIFTASHPGDLAPIDDDFHLPSDVRTLAEVLSLYGYETAAFTGGAHMTGALGMGRGYGLYRDDVHFGSFFHSVQLAEYWLDQPHPDPFLLFVHGYDCHSPYVKPLFFEHLFDQGYSGVADRIIPQRTGVESVHEGRFYPELRPEVVTNTAGRRYIGDDFFLDALPRAAAEGRPSLPVSQRDLDHMVAHYDGALAYADLWLGLLLAGLEASGHAEDTVVIVFSDHGEGLTDYGHFQHRPHLREHVIRVPLVIQAPGRVREGARIDSFVSAIDIAPTVLEMAGVPPLQGVAGRSLVPLLEGRAPGHQAPVFSQSRHQVTVRVPGEQLVLDTAVLNPTSARAASAAPRGYYRFDGELEPSAEPVGPEALELRLRAWVEGLEPSADAGPGLDQELRDALRERGYW